MKKRDILVDLTPLLDVILILFFMMLLQSTGEMVDYRTQLQESEEQRIIMEQELDDTKVAYQNMSERLSALSDWDNDRLSLIDELESINEWKTAVESAVYFIAIDVQPSDNNRFVNISALPDKHYTIDVIWADDGGSIINRNYITEELHIALTEIIMSRTGTQPVLIMFEEPTYNREDVIIKEAIRSFINDAVMEHDLSIYTAFHKSN